ncbi:MAG: sensor histidine kinase [Syntrophobacteraceae bacterium]
MIRLSKIRELLTVSVLLFLLSGCGATRGRTPLARKGVIDLSRVSILQGRPVRLDGPWAFYRNRLLSPSDFTGPHPPAVSAYMSLPRAWNGFRVAGQRLGAQGCATFRLLVRTGPLDGNIALRLCGFTSACRFWVNGRLLAISGVVGKSPSQETPAQSVPIVILPVHGRSIELVLQVSNYHYREGGVVSSIEMGSPAKIEAAQMRRWGMALFCIGSMLMIGLYHLFLYCFRRKNTAPLYFGLYCLLWMGFLLTDDSTDWVGDLLFRHISVPLLNRLDLLCLVLSVPVGYGFLRALYPEEFSLLAQKFSWFAAGIFAFSGIVLPTMAFTSVMPFYYVIAAVLIFYCVARLFTATRRKRQGAMFILVGFLALGFAGLNDMLYDMQFIRSAYVIEWGIFIFILFQTFGLSSRFSSAFAAVELLSDKLADKNLSLEKEMAERLRLEREIVNISEEERRRISRELHDGLCQLLTGARLHLSALRRKLLGGVAEHPPEWRRLSELLEQSVDLAYDLSRGLWPVDHDPSGVSPSLEELTRRLGESSGIAIEFQQRCTCTECSNAGVTQFFRIAQEAITNAVRHARPTRIRVSLACVDRTIILTVSDDGIGRDNAQKSRGGLGLAIMAHRARTIGGRLTVADGEQGGTVVTCSAPCEGNSGEGSNR